MTLRIMPELIAICLDQVEGKDQAGEHDGDRGAQLDQNVQGRAGSILERVADGVADNGSLVLLAALAAVVAPSIYFFALSQAPPALDMNTAIAKPVTDTPPSRPTTPVGPRMRPVARGTTMASRAGATIS